MGMAGVRDERASGGGRGRGDEGEGGEIWEKGLDTTRQADTKNLTSSSKFSGSCVLT